MKNKNPTLKDIAQKLGISISTVSRALRGMPEINVETREAVLKMSKDLDYNLVTNQSDQQSQKNLVGVILPTLNYYYTSILKGIEEAALRAGFTVLISLTNESYGREVANVSKLLQANIHGLIIVKALQTKNFEHLNKCVQKDIPIVLIDRECSEINAPRVFLDNVAGSILALKHLIEKGYKKIAFVGLKHESNANDSKLQGFKVVLKEIKMEVNEKNVFLDDFDTFKAYEKTKEILRTNDRPDAFFAENDQIAVGIMEAIHEFGYNIPKDYGVIGYMDEPYVANLTPSLSSIAVPTFEIGQQAVNTLIEQIVQEQNNLNNTALAFQPKLMARESTNLQKRFFGI